MTMETVPEPRSHIRQQLYLWLMNTGELYADLCVARSNVLHYGSSQKMRSVVQKAANDFNKRMADAVDWRFTAQDVAAVTRRMNEETKATPDEWQWLFEPGALERVRKSNARA